MSRKYKLLLTAFTLIVFSMISQTAGNYDVISNPLTAISSVVNLNAKFHATHYPVGSFPQPDNQEISLLVHNHTRPYYESIENRTGCTLIISAFIGPSGRVSQISVLQGPESGVPGASMLVTGTIEAIKEANWIWYDQEVAESGIWMAIPVQFGVDGVFNAVTRFVITDAAKLSSMRLDHPIEYATPPKLLSDLLLSDHDLSSIEGFRDPKKLLISNIWVYVNQAGRVEILSWWPGAVEEIISILALMLRDSEWQPALKSDGTPVGSWVNVVLSESNLGLIAQSY